MEERIRRIELLERAVQAHSDRLEKLSLLQQENAVFVSKIDETTRYTEVAKEYLADFPQDSFVLKLERRVESLRDQLKQAERIANQHRAGIDAYHRRLQHCRAGRSETVEGISEVLDEIEDSLVALCNEEVSLSQFGDVLSAVETLSAIASERETSLQRQQDNFEEKIAQEAQLSEAMVLLQARAQEDLPAIEKQKQQEEDELAAEWTKEHLYLQGLHEKLLAVHREQTFHLQRGTHIKAKANVAAESEKVLSARQSLLANEIISRKAALTELREDVVHAKKLSDILRTKARAAQKEFEAAVHEKESRLTKFRKDLDEANEELNELRNTKAKLYEALQDIRDHNPARTLRIAQ